MTFRPVSWSPARLGFLLVLLPAVLSAASERGLPLVKAYTRLDHKAHTSFHAPFVSPDGLYYAGNQLALMEFDGRTWRILKIPLTYTRALAPDSAGNIYVGDEEQLGVVARPGTGEPDFRSLLDRVPADAKPFGFVRDVVVRGSDIFFATDKNILRYNPAANRFHVWPLAGDFRNRLRVVAGRVILHRRGEGLHELRNDAWYPLSHDATLAAAPEGGFVVADDTAPAGLLVGLSNRGLFRLQHDGTLQPWSTDADPILARTQLLAAERLSDGSLAIGTASEGLIVLRQDGRLERHLTRESGLPHLTVFALAEDADGGLWLSTNHGPARVNWRSAATWFDHQHSGITDAAAADFTRHEGVFHYLTTDGLYRLVPSADPRLPARFERDRRVDVQVRLTSLLSHPGGLLLASATGLQRLGPNGLELLAAVQDGLKCLTRSTSDPARIFFSTDRDVGTGRFLADGTWVNDGTLPGVVGECEDVVEDADGTVWVSTVSRGVYRVTRRAGSADWREADVKLLTTADGLPEGHSLIFLWKTGLGLHFDTAHGLYRYDPATARFVADTPLTAWEARPMVLNPVAGGAPRELWTNGLLTDYKTKEVPYPLLRLRRAADGTIEPFAMPDEIHALFAGSGARRIFWEPGRNGESDVVWGKGELGLVRVEVDRLAPPRPVAPPLIRDIQAEGHTVEFSGAGPDALTLKFSPEPIVITFASGRFGTSEFERFQTRLLGFNDSWSAPTRRNDVTFTNLERGPFTFEVRTVDARGQAGPPARFTLYVAPPWPRSNLAYALYALAFGGAVVGFIRHRLRRATREQARLETLVIHRTAELAAANKAKSAFLANMSHELRTPLNGVIGYAQVLQKSAHIVPQDRERLRIVQTSGEHLLRMINEVLDFSKIEAGKLELRPAPFNLPQLLRDLFTALEARALQKQLHFSLEIGTDLPATVIGDAQKLRQILDNLLGNAVKFTARGAVVLRAFPTAGRIAFAVEDTGAGIAEKEQANLFQPFHQPVDGRPPEPGTGLGLAIARRLVELMDGELTVESALGRGSTFSFALPLEALATGTHDAQPAARPPIGYHGERRRLLVVDDVAVNRAIVVELLSPLGFDLREAANGDAALAAMPDFQPHVVFLDLRMPGMDGLELARRLRALPGVHGPLALIAMSASVLSFNRDSALEAGCDDFLPKPFREADLIAKLTMHLRIAWRYENESAAPSLAASDTPAANESLRELLDMARRGEIRPLRERLAALRTSHPNDTRLAPLEALASGYQMERLRTALAEFVAEETPPRSAS